MKRISSQGGGGEDSGKERKGGEDGGHLSNKRGTRFSMLIVNKCIIIPS